MTYTTQSTKLRMLGKNCALYFACLLSISIVESAGSAPAATATNNLLASHAENRDRLQKGAAGTEKDLNEEAGRVANSLSVWDQDPAYRIKSDSLLSDAMKKFAAYRDGYCAFMGSLAAGGNSTTDIVASCVSALNEHQRKMLKTADKLIKQAN